MQRALNAGAGARHAGLTRLRFALIAWVILYHLDLPLHVTREWPALAPVIRRGYLGVDGFFLLSGFALWLGYGARPPRGAAGIGGFLLRRIAKIWPLHLAALLALALLVGLALAVGVPIREPERFGAGDFLLQAALIHAWETSHHFAWNYPSWALSVEWAGYLAFPLVLAALLRLPAPLVPLVPAAGLFGLHMLEVAGPQATLNYTMHLGLARFALEFVAALALGRLATEHRLPAWLPWLALPALPAGLWLDHDALAVVGLAGLLLLLWRGGRAGPARPGLLLRLGEASFGIYLSWIFVEAALVAVLRVAEPGPLGRAGLLGAGFVATLGLGWLAWAWVEVPAHRWLLARRLGAGAALPLKTRA